MPKDTSHELDAIALAIAHRKLAAADIVALRASIAGLNDAAAAHRFVRATLRNLKVAATQLKDFQSKAAGPLDEDSFAALPAHLRRRILARFDSLAARLAGLESARPASSKAPPKPADDADPAFLCLRDYEASRAQPGASAFWCQLSLVICLLRSVLQIVRQPQAQPGPK